MDRTITEGVMEDPEARELPKVAEKPVTPTIDSELDDDTAPEHPQGALVLILIYLLLVVLLWTHTYLRLWIRG
jgi:hypothetical protein